MASTQRAADHGEYLAYDQAFHRILLEASGNPGFRALSKAVVEALSGQDGPRIDAAHGQPRSDPAARGGRGGGARGATGHRRRRRRCALIVEEADAAVQAMARGEGASTGDGCGIPGRRSLRPRIRDVVLEPALSGGRRACRRPPGRTPPGSDDDWPPPDIVPRAIAMTTTMRATQARRMPRIPRRRPRGGRGSGRSWPVAAANGLPAGGSGEGVKARR
ncbi:hypothetical protein ACU4GD_45395 [Cupriavidus basilensis]